MRLELDTTPKPGLVDRQNNGAHKDMDYALMSKSISALRPYLTRLAVESAKDIDPAKIKEVGIEAEKAMLKATGGVNTHKGALFSIGLSVAAASNLASATGSVQVYSFKELVSRVASEIPAAQVRTVPRQREVSRSVARLRRPWSLSGTIRRLAAVLSQLGR